MATTVDHCAVDARVRVIRSFRDARGTWVAEGTEGVIVHLATDWSTQEIVFRWRRHDGEEELRFAMRLRTPGSPLPAADFSPGDDSGDASGSDAGLGIGLGIGPGIGRMRIYFERLGDAGEGTRETPGATAPEAHAARLSGPLPEDPLRRVIALAERHDFAAAELALAAVVGIGSEETAQEVQQAAERAAHERDKARFAWLRSLAERCWYAWSSQATSGGEGAVKLLTLRPALARLDACERTIGSADAINAKR